MDNRQTSKAAFPFGNNHICEIQFENFDQIIISKGLRVWVMRHLSLGCERRSCAEIGNKCCSGLLCTGTANPFECGNTFGVLVTRCLKVPNGAKFLLRFQSLHVQMKGKRLNARNGSASDWSDCSFLQGGGERKNTETRSWCWFGGYRYRCTGSH